MLTKIAYAAVVGIVVFLLALILLPLLSLPTAPWAAILGLLCAVIAFSSGRLR